MSTGVMLFNPFTGTPRHPDDIKSDPDGFLLWDGESRLKAAKAAPPAQPFAWYDPSADRFTRDMDDPSMNRGAVLWRLFLDAQPSAERPCSTCAHFKQGSNPLVGVYDADCFECKHYYASKWEKKP